MFCLFQNENFEKRKYLPNSCSEQRSQEDCKQVSKIDLCWWIIYPLILGPLYITMAFMQISFRRRKSICLQCATLIMALTFQTISLEAVVPALSMSANLADISFLILRDLHLAVFTVVWKESRWQYWTLAICILWGNLALQYILLSINTTVLKYTKSYKN